MFDLIRVLRVIEYVGPRILVEEQIKKSLHGEKRVGPNGEIRIRAVTIGEFPDKFVQDEYDEPPMAGTEVAEGMVSPPDTPEDWTYGTPPLGPQE